MGKVSEKFEHIRDAVKTIATSQRAVARWARMANVLSEHVRQAIEFGHDDIFRDEAFRRGIGYLALPPKMILVEKREKGSVPRDDFLTEADVAQMSGFFVEMLKDLEEWLSRNRYDEAPRFPENGSESIGRKAYLLVKRAMDGEIKLFKTISRGTLFCPCFFELLAEVMPLKPISPDDFDKTLSDMNERSKAEAAEREETRRFREQVVAGLNILAGDALTDGATHERKGTPGEIAQEDEVLRLHRAGKMGSLMAAVRFVLRNPQFAFPDGHPATKAGFGKCYARVYAILHPLRRRRKRK